MDFTIQPFIVYLHGSNATPHEFLVPLLEHKIGLISFESCTFVHMSENKTHYYIHYYYSKL